MHHKNTFIFRIAIVCLACPAGEYRSADNTTCQQCPGNTEIDVEAASVCECQSSYFRNDEDFTASDADHLVLPANEIPSNSCSGTHSLNEAVPNLLLKLCIDM